MSALSSLLVAIGLLSLAHAAYSAHEFSAAAAAASSAHHQSRPSLPLDIQLETIVAVSLACAGLVLGSPSLKPISWSAWAGKIEKEGGAANPFRAMEDRPGFMDIRAKRKEFADWVRGQESSTKQ